MKKLICGMVLGLSVLSMSVPTTSVKAASVSVSKPKIKSIKRYEGKEEDDIKIKLGKLPSKKGYTYCYQIKKVFNDNAGKRESPIYSTSSSTLHDGCDKQTSITYKVRIKQSKKNKKKNSRFYTVTNHYSSWVSKTSKSTLSKKR